jgi:uncharacterized protein YbjT (DUF2867 family)
MTAAQQQRGRAMAIPSGVTRRVATVFGGSGFIGRYVVKRLAQRGYVVRVAVTDPEAALFLKPAGTVGQIVPLYANVTSDGLVERAVEGAEVVVNLVGVLSEKRRGDFDALQHLGAGRVARLSAAAGVGKLVQVSAIGADPDSPSGYASSKGSGERAVREAFPAATILRPSLVFGQEDAFFNRFGVIAQLSPVMPVISGPTRMQPVFVADVADAAMAAIQRPDAGGTIYELGGPRVWTFRELLQYIVTITHRRCFLVDVPMGIARIQASVMERLPGKPLTRDQLLMLTRDTICGPGMPGLPDLGVVPTPVELIVPGYLARFQPGGGRVRIVPGQLERAEADLPPSV